MDQIDGPLQEQSCAQLYSIRKYMIPTVQKRLLMWLVICLLINSYSLSRYCVNPESSEEYF